MLTKYFSIVKVLRWTLYDFRELSSLVKHFLPCYISALPATLLFSATNNQLLYPNPKSSLPYRYFTKYHFIFSYHRNNMPERVCVYNFSDSATWMCNIFKLGDIISDNPGWLLRCLLRPGDMVTAAGGDYTKLSVGGGVVAIHIQWICNLDWDFLKYCLPKWVLIHTRIPSNSAQLAIYTVNRP